MKKPILDKDWPTFARNRSLSFDRGFEAIRDGNFELGVRWMHQYRRRSNSCNFYGSLQRRYGDSLAALDPRGFSLLQLGRYEEAKLSGLLEAENFTSNGYENYKCAARIYVRYREWDKAKKCIEEMITSKTDSGGKIAPDKYYLVEIEDLGKKEDTEEAARVYEMFPKRDENGRFWWLA